MRSLAIRLYFFPTIFGSLIVFICLFLFFWWLVPQQSMWRCNNNSRLLLSLKFKNACDILLQTALLRTIKMHFCIMVVRHSRTRTTLLCNIFFPLVQWRIFCLYHVICVVIAVRCNVFFSAAVSRDAAQIRYVALIVHRLYDDAFLLHTKFTTLLCLAQESTPK